ncbi:hypothetical protein GFS24_09910 [Chitinophaga sp. SYP-B3965]|uniref:hypothetical protein n=1 Tax=Chitinophaga sp. SYP-B3965 TaxID=2663120 RepID=UPI001299E42F|nr:hypothetical protein [Chitinophaga sp. SYP-B3965]MRG45431.1 hypothetical protein [Chitinophaga sp. SYP-B3965]
MILIAIIAPWLSFLLRGKLLSALVAFILELFAVLLFLFFMPAFFVLWFIVATWAISSYNNAKADKRNRQLIRAMRYNS